MNIPTILEANRVSKCCGCDWPSCPDPIKECQSIYKSGRGFKLAEESDGEDGLTEEEACNHYLRMDFLRTTDSTSFWDSGTGWTMDDEETSEETLVYRNSDLLNHYFGSPNYGDIVSGEYSRRRIRKAATPYGYDNYTDTYSGFVVTSGQTAHYKVTHSWTQEGVYKEVAHSYEGEEELIFSTYPWLPNPRLSALVYGTTVESETAEGQTFYDFDGNLITWASTGTSKEVIRHTYSEPFSLPVVLPEMEFPDDATGHECVSLLAVSCLRVEVQKVRYRFSVPYEYSTDEVPRSTYELAWDEMTATNAWWNWYDSGMEGDPPDESLKLVAEKSWKWGKSMDDLLRWSDWYDLQIPETPGQTRVVNVMTTCWKSARLGNKPTAYGDQVALP